MHSVALGVIDEAHGHRRRRTRILGVSVSTGIALGLAVTRIGGSANLFPGSRAPSRAPATVFSQAPDMGVACHRGACNSLGLAVWLRTPAVSVSATVAGHRFGLTTWQASPYMPQAPRKMFVGYLTPIRLVTTVRLLNGAVASWPTPDIPDPFVSLRITYGPGRVVETRLRVPIQPGWG